MAHAPAQPRAFTLIELILVLIILSVMVAMAAPSLRGWGQGQKLKNATTEFVAATGNARSRALSTATPHAVEIDTGKNTFAVKSVERDGTRKPVPGDFGLDTALATDFKIRLTSGGANASPQSGVAANGTVILFFPDARCTPATVEIESSNGDVARIESRSPAEPFREVTAK